MTTPNTPADEHSGLAEEEIETLKAIYIKELEVIHDEKFGSLFPVSILMNLHPATADNADEQYVRLTLIINIPLKYPNALPVFVIRNPRGLSDEDLQRIQDDLCVKAEGCRGLPMLYELIELAKEHLTTGNTPRCSCAICLYGFCDEDAFIKTDCYHYFHTHCLRRYVDSSDIVDGVQDCEKKILCPVCREPILYVRNELGEPPRPPMRSEAAQNFVPDAALLRLQRKMAALYVYQKSRGGIIDIEAEKNKFLLAISAVPNSLDSTSTFSKLDSRSIRSNKSSNSSKSVAPEEPKMKLKFSKGTDSKHDASSEASASNVKRVEYERTNAGNNNDAGGIREGRRAPRRGSQHGWARKLSRGGGSSSSSGGSVHHTSRDPVASGVSSSTSASNNCNGHVSDRTFSDRRGGSSHLTTTPRGSVKSRPSHNHRRSAPPSSNPVGRTNVNHPGEDRRPNSQLLVTGPPSEGFSTTS